MISLVEPGRLVLKYTTTRAHNLSRVVEELLTSINPKLGFCERAQTLVNGNLKAELKARETRPLDYEIRRLLEPLLKITTYSCDTIPATLDDTFHVFEYLCRSSMVRIIYFVLSVKTN